MTSLGEDEVRMRRALSLAERGRGCVSPNPLVGACLYRRRRLIAEAYHQQAGKAHAEIMVLRKADARARGAALYVTLEPCSTWGKTPPCVEAIIKSGIRRVVIGAPDPNPVHTQKGIRALRRAGLSVSAGILRRAVLRQNEVFWKWIRTHRPFVTLKMAESLDGKIATRQGEARGITGPHAQRFVHRLRSEVDGILVGKKTVFQDNPRLTIRHIKSKRKPWRIILNTSGDLPLARRVFQDHQPTILICAYSHLRQTVKKFSGTSICILPVEKRGHWLNLEAVLDRLGAMGVTSILVEGGGEVAAGFIEQKLADKFYFLVAPKIIGGRRALTAVEGNGAGRIRSVFQTRDVVMSKLGNDFIFQGYF